MMVIVYIMSTDIDECMAGSDNCGGGTTCVNTEGSFTCDGRLKGDVQLCSRYCLTINIRH